MSKNIEDDAVKTDTFSHRDGSSEDAESKQLSNQLGPSMSSLISSSGSEFSGSGRIEVERTRNKFLFLKADSHFRHRIPFFVNVRCFVVHRWQSCKRCFKAVLPMLSVSDSMGCKTRSAA